MAAYLLLSAAIWAWLAFAGLRNVLGTPLLPRDVQPAGVPQVSVVVAGRDEAARIEQTIRGILAQRGVEIELIVVDDRSRDATPDILRRLAAEFPQLRSLRIDELPPGWLGKCHACWRGVAQANHRWLLFTDADIHMQPALIARAVAVAERERADHLTLLPGLNSRGSLTRACILAWWQCLSLYVAPWKINRDRGRRGIGIGAFNLVRREAYAAIGGHETLALETVDDVKLGHLIRQKGFRQRLYGGYADLEAEWAHSTLQAIRAAEKNWFAGMHYNTPLSIAVILSLLAIWLAGPLGPLLHPVFGWVALAGWCLPIVPAAMHARQFGWPLAVALLTPLGYLLFAAAGIHSTWKTLRQGGIRWRDTFYPLADLRKGLVR